MTIRLSFALLDEDFESSTKTTKNSIIPMMISIFNMNRIILCLLLSTLFNIHIVPGLSLSLPVRKVYLPANKIHYERRQLYHRTQTTSLKADTAEQIDAEQTKQVDPAAFDLSTALFCAGLAFDAYVEPEPSSSRWERGSKGLQVAFCSPAYTRQLYKGLVEVKVEKCMGLPNEDDSAAERLLSGSGVDACLLVAILEGSWKEDIAMLEKEQYHEGVMDLAGAAHVSRSSTCWSTVDQRKAELNAKLGRPLPYHIPGAWGRAPQAVWPESEPPFYLYVQDPSTARLVFTIIDDDKLGDGSPVGSTHQRLKDLIPQAGLSQEKIVEELKKKVLDKIKETGSMDALDDLTKFELGAQVWQGVLPLTSKPRKKDKNGQIVAAAAAGAMVAGPIGAAAGAVIGSFYEGGVTGKVQLRLKYLPIPQVPVERKTYIVKGGMPGIDWGNLYFNYNSVKTKGVTSDDKISSNDYENVRSSFSAVDDLEHCFFVNHEKTGATCAVYRSLEKKFIVVSFRGTCQLVDLLTDTSITQEAWTEGEDVKLPETVKVHVGFRGSMNSISRRLKELILAAPGPNESIADYDVYVTGHSLGGALATLFTADIGQFGIDAGRGLPQLAPSEPWWKAIANTFTGMAALGDKDSGGPPRPKSLRMYNFGSPRVGNEAFKALFDSLIVEGKILCAYRIVNGDDVVARMPRTMNALVASVGYDHVGKTALIAQPNDALVDVEGRAAPPLWIEGVSDDRRCPVRDGATLVNPLKAGSFLGDILTTSDDNQQESKSSLSWTEQISAAAGKLSDRLKTASVSDIASIVGIDKSFSEREIKLIRSLVQGKALAHHMEDEYYAGMGRASGFLAKVGEEIEALD
jgi:Lipase (class 3)